MKNFEPSSDILKTKMAPYTHLFIIATIILVMTLIGFSIFSLISLQNLEERNAKLQQDLYALQSALSDQKATIAENIETMKLNQTFTVRAEKLFQDYTSDKQRFEASLNEQNTKLDELANRFAYLSDFIEGKNDATAIKNASKPLPFSYFLSEEWATKVGALKQKLNEAGILGTAFNGGGGEDTADSPASEEIFIDGIRFISVEIYRVAHVSPNTIHILAPGLVNLENDTLTIYADKNLDQVNLDGCLVWKQIQTNKDFTVWSALDINGDTRTVKISADVPTKVQEQCDNRYLNRYISKVLLSSLGTPVVPPTPAPPEEASFGGIGIAFKGNGNYISGLEITGVISGKPADKAGLKATDNIVKIDDIPVSNMSRADVMMRMRGNVGSEVKLTYIPGGLTADKSKVVTLIREKIDAPKAVQSFSRPQAY